MDDKENMNNIHSNDIHVVINRIDLADEYNRHAGVTIASILENTSERITFHITYDGAKSNKNQNSLNENIHNYQKLVSKYGSNIEFIDLQDFRWDKRIPEDIVKTWSVVSLCRLQLQDIFPSLDKTIVLGIDTIVETDIAEYIKLASDEMSISAVRDSGVIPQFKSSNDAVKNDLTKYFNIDAVILNLAQIRKKNTIIDRIREYLIQTPKPTCLEQDALNYAFFGDVYYLPDKYNIISYNVVTYNEETQTNTLNLNLDYDFILHYASPYSKPWIKYHGDIDKWYWKYLAKTPWGNDYLTYVRIAPDYNVCLPLIEKNLFAYIDGSPQYKIKFSLKFITQMGLNICKHLWIIGWWKIRQWIYYKILYKPNN